MRFKDALTILSQGEPGETPEVMAQPGSEDLLSRINNTIANFIELLSLAKQMRGDTAGQPGENEPGPGASGLAQLVQVLIQSGYGDTPVGELLESIKPYGITQLIRMVENVRPKR